MRAVFGEAEDAVIFCYKLGGKMVYLFGMTIPALLDWTPPSKATEMVNESALLQSWKATHSDLKELVPLVNTETHKNLVALADKFMSHMPTFAVAKIKDSKAAARWCANSFSANVRVIVDASEVEERKRAAEKSKTAGDKTRVESAAGGAAAKQFWSDRKRLLLAVQPYYEDSFSERFIVVALDEQTGQPTAETLSKLRSDLECASSQLSNASRLSPLASRLSPRLSARMHCRHRDDDFSVQLIKSLDVAVADFARGDNADKWIVDSGSPLGRYLVEKTADTEDEDEEEPAADASAATAATTGAADDAAAVDAAVHAGADAAAAGATPAVAAEELIAAEEPAAAVSRRPSRAARATPAAAAAAPAPEPAAEAKSRSGKRKSAEAEGADGAAPAVGNKKGRPELTAETKLARAEEARAKLAKELLGVQQDTSRVLGSLKDEHAKAISKLQLQVARLGSKCLALP